MMERAHVLVRLQGDDSSSCVAGICRTSATTVRLEHSEMSPGVASITFEQVFNIGDSNPHVFQTSLTSAVDSVVDGKEATLIATGASSSGKSFSCHGDQQKLGRGQAEPGLITLAIRRIFTCLESNSDAVTQHNVLLSCWSVDTSRNNAFTDLLEAGTSVDAQDMTQGLLERSVVVTTSAEAVHLYSKALERVNGAEKQDFVFVLHVETLLKTGEATRGQLVVIDIQGSSIIESRAGSLTNQEQKNESEQKFLDTQFLVNETLSAGFGAFVGNSSTTYLLVTIQTPAQFQQQAIQSLLYACKAKEIKSSSSVNYISAFVKRSRSNRLLHVEMHKESLNKSESQPPGCREDYMVPDAPPIQAFSRECSAFFSDRSLPPVPPSLSTASSNSTLEIPFRTPPDMVSPNLSSSTSCESEESHKQLAVSRRLRKAYDIAKAATSAPRKLNTTLTPRSNQDDEALAHAAADDLLQHISRDTLRGLTLQEKLVEIRSAQAELERTLAHEISIKDKCVDRISRLSQTISCQVVEHEQRLQEALTAKHTAETELRDQNIKFDAVGREVNRLQDEIQALKVFQTSTASCNDTHSPDNERVMLHTLSNRLEEAMVQAKDVITFKDSVIKSLEERLQLASKRGADAVTLLGEERNRFECEKAELLLQLQQSKDSRSIQRDEEVSKLHAESLAIQQQKADLTVKVAQLTLDLETVRSQWAQEAQNREDRAEQRCTQQVAKAEQQLDQATAAMQQQMALFREELDMKVARQRVATQVACKAGELKCDHLERELQRVTLKLAKQKLKMEKKARALVANVRKQQEEPLVLLERELGDLSEQMKIAVEREQGALRRVKKSEEAADRLKDEVQQLKISVTKVEQERVALGDVCEVLETDKAALKSEFEHRIREMEKALAEQIMAAEVRVHEERDLQVEKLTQRYNAEICRLTTEAKGREENMSKQLARQQSVSSVSSSSEDGRQPSIDELDALIDSKERRYARAEKRKKAGSSSRASPPTKSSSASLKRALAHKEEEIAELSTRQKQLLAALATANEQETRAKKHIQESETHRQNELIRYDNLLRELNNVKQENWNLSLALHVTESTNQQQQRRPPRANSTS
ncbi:Kinesin-related protein 4 [Phytophthora citrophthora]|uniref:Kinesin-related protein 4 n=1 Tax=Phytophthora citrophthora TaxID=4793 RepID=A0AAD9LJ35_9STRA|nr:Kinesin-related protein 4 [Phytophthora citrophthora]